MPSATTTRLGAWIDDTLDLSRPNAARMDDHFLGGCHNFTIDRDLADQVIVAAPDFVGAVRANRTFLGRAVRYALGQGILQFLDIGCGIPALGSVHQLVHAADPDGRVVCVDADPVAVAYTQRTLADAPTAGVIHADLRDTDAILDHDVTSRLFDFTQPLCLLAVSVLHFVNGDINTPVAVLRERMCPGSLLVITHATQPNLHHAEQSDAVQALYAQTTTPIRYRSHDDVEALFTGFDLIAPSVDTEQPVGLVPVGQWRPESPSDADPRSTDDAATCVGFLAGVGHKPPASSAAKRRTVAAARPVVTATRLTAAGSLVHTEMAKLTGRPVVVTKRRLRRQPFATTRRSRTVRGTS